MHINDDTRDTRDDERDVGFASATPQPLTRLGTDRLKCCIERMILKYERCMLICEI